MKQNGTGIGQTGLLPRQTTHGRKLVGHRHGRMHGRLFSIGEMGHIIHDADTGNRGQLSRSSRRFGGTETQAVHAAVDFDMHTDILRLCSTKDGDLPR